MATIFYDSDANQELIRNKKVAIIGYGSQGHAHSQNLNDSGVEVQVGLHKESKSRKKAKGDGLIVNTVKDAAAWADTIMILAPDTMQPAIYESEIAPQLTPGKTLMFGHGFNIRYGTITPPEYVDVSMVAPKAPGHRVREMYVEGEGTPALLAVHQDASGTAKENAISSALVKMGFETLVNAGYQPELAYFECMHELKLIVDLMYRGGLNYMRYSVSDTAEYGDYHAGTKVVTEDSRKAMDNLLHDIQDGTFAKVWIDENKGGRKWFNKIRRSEQDHQIEKVGAALRAMMPFVDSVTIKPGD
jgi:ketol-acid reductoisomerase